MTGNVLKVVRLLQGQDIAPPAVLNLVSYNCNKCHNAHAASMISLALRSVSAWVEQHVKIPLHADRFRIATAKIEWLVITSTRRQSNVI